MNFRSWRFLKKTEGISGIAPKQNERKAYTLKAEPQSELT
jgi:hypothetical protein